MRLKGAWKMGGDPSEKAIAAAFKRAREGRRERLPTEEELRAAPEEEETTTPTSTRRGKGTG